AKPATEVPPAEQTGSLTVLDWAGYDGADFWTDFKTTYPKVTMNFEIGESDADIYSKMKAGDKADIFHPYTGWLQFYVDEGLVQEIDTSRLTNWDKVPDYFKKIGQVNGKQYFVPWDWGFSSIIYRTDKIPEGVNSWSALLDQKLAVATGNNVVNMFYYGDVNQDVMNGITDPTLKEAFSVGDPDILNKTNFTPNLTAAQRDAWTAMWAEVKAAP